MATPTIHLICNAHLDPVWQWRWEEGLSEALSTFGTAVRMLHRHKQLIFNHNEAVLYRWVEQNDPALFRQICRLVREGRWCIAGGWYLQPDANLPGTESFIRHITEGRNFFFKHFKSRPRVAYNFDSFGHTGGLPQILRRAGYDLYIHMRPQSNELALPSDLYRWRGIDGSEILTYRIAVGLYHTERDNILQRLEEGTELARRLKRDVPVFWGIGNHGGGATEEDLDTIAAFISRTTKVRIRHSTTELLYRAFRPLAARAPVVEGDLQRVFTGCYTSLSRLKRRAVTGLAEIVQAETVASFAWWCDRSEYPEDELQEAWRHHLFNDFHDILPGSCTEPAERDALDQYGCASAVARRVRMSAVSALNRGKHRQLYIPVTVVNTNPSCARVPVDVECMLDLRPKWTGTWHLGLFTLDGTEIPCQEEQPESLLPFNGWRRKVSFLADLPHVGTARYELRIAGGPPAAPGSTPAINHAIDTQTGLVTSFDAGAGRECLAGPAFQPIVVDDDGDSWGANRWAYRNVVGRFVPVPGSAVLVHPGPVRRIYESAFSWHESSITCRTISYPMWPVTEFHFRVHWKEKRKRLKFAIPTVFRADGILCEIPGGTITRPADGQEHVHGRWCMLEGMIDDRPTALAVINSGQHGLDFADGEIRLSVLRSAAYCHEQGFVLTDPPSRKYMDQGIHEFRLLVTAGNSADVRQQVTGLADWLSAPPAAYAHLPIGVPPDKDSLPGTPGGVSVFFGLTPSNVRLCACKRSRDGKALILRLQETSGHSSNARLSLSIPNISLRLSFSSYEIKTLRIERNGTWREVHMVEES